MVQATEKLPAGAIKVRALAQAAEYVLDLKADKCLCIEGFLKEASHVGTKKI